MCFIDIYNIYLRSKFKPIYFMTINIIDCTFRDGGYYNNWHFSKDLCNNYLDAISKSGIKYVEIGYKRINTNAFLGPFAFCKESFIKKHKVPKNINLGVMVNILDFISTKDLKKTVALNFSLQKNSIFKFIRIATTYKDFNLALKLSALLKSLNYSVFINIMQCTELEEKNFKAFSKKINSSNAPNAIYFADTFGNLEYQKIKNLINLINKYLKTRIGFHAHNNANNALNNTLFAINNGVQWADCTVLGMGRGAGNLQSEYLLMELEKTSHKFKSEPLYPLVLGEFHELKEKYQWGENLLYRLAANFKIHPSYVQELTSQGNFKNYQLLDALTFLKKQKDTGFDKSKINEAIFSYTTDSPGNYNPKKFIKGKSVLIIANGPGISKYSEDLIDLIKQEKPIVISLNLNKYIAYKYIDAYACCHPSRILLEANDICKQKKPLITPFQSLPHEIKNKFKKNLILDYGLTIKDNKFLLEDKKCTISSPLVLIYSLAFCLTGYAKKIWLAGFDGYSNEDQRQLEINKALQFFNVKFKSSKITFITPTTFNGNKVAIYSILK